MAGTFIPALAIQKGTTVYFNPDATYGSTELIPTPGAGGIVDGDYLAEAVAGFGLDEGGFNYQVVGPNFSPLPNPNSFHVVRISTRSQGSDVWWVVGTSTDYLASCQAAECCSAAVPMPTVVPPLYPCQLLCQTNADGDYIGIWALPTLGVGQNYYAAGFFNDVPLTALSGAGYSTPTALLAAMNTSWANVGAWTGVGSPETIFVTQADGPGTDVVCIRIYVA